MNSRRKVSDEELCKLFAEGYGIHRIAKLKGMAKPSVAERLLKLGLRRGPANPLSQGEWETLLRLGESPCYASLWPAVRKLAVHHGVLHE